MKRGEVWWVDFEPARDGEIRKVRPAVIISNNIANKVMNRVQVVPITSKVAKCYPCEAYLHVQGEPAKAMADQIATVSKARFKTCIGQLQQDDIQAIERALKLQLQLS